MVAAAVNEAIKDIEYEAAAASAEVNVCLFLTGVPQFCISKRGLSQSPTQSVSMKLVELALPLLNPYTSFLSGTQQVDDPQLMP